MTDLRDVPVPRPGSARAPGPTLHEQLAEAVRAENYELAAQIRDRIRGQAPERNAAGPG